jgi:GTP1/Obg family GTP-binding protein
MEVLIQDITTAFYTRKVKYTAETFTERLSATLEAFPRLQDIHPFRKGLKMARIIT